MWFKLFVKQWIVIILVLLTIEYPSEKSQSWSIPAFIGPELKKEARTLERDFRVIYTVRKKEKASFTKETQGTSLFGGQAENVNTEN